MPDVQRALDRLDSYQQRHKWAAVAFAVQKKFGDDAGGSLSALMTYYAFLSLFPLLLVFVTVLGYVLQDNQDLQRRIIDSAFGEFPVIGDQLRHNIGSVRGSGVGLVIGILLTFYGGLGVGQAAQDAMNRVWSVPFVVRPGFFPKLLRSLELMAILALSIIATTALNAVAGRNVDMWARVVIFFATFVLNIGLFSIGFRVLTARKLSLGDVLPGAIISAAGWAILQLIGEIVLTHMIRNMSSTYGVFAIVLGLIAWIFLQSRIVMYSAEVNVVRVQQLFPRSLFPPPLTDADRRAFELYALAQERRPEARLEVSFRGSDAPSAEDATVH